MSTCAHASAELLASFLCELHPDHAVHAPNALCLCAMVCVMVRWPACLQSGEGPGGLQ